MIVFDMDDTLYLERDFAFSGYRALDAIVTKETGVPGFGAACRALFEEGERRQIFDKVCASLGIEATPAFIQSLITAYRSHTPRITLCEDVPRFFTRFNLPFGLISDGPAHMQRNKVDALGISGHIPHIRLTGDWEDGFGKPHPRAFEEMEALSSRPTHMVYIADNPAKDFVTPNARGWRSIQITRAGGVHDPDPPAQSHAATLSLSSLDELSPSDLDALFVE